MRASVRNPILIVILLKGVWFRNTENLLGLNSSRRKPPDVLAYGMERPL